MQSIIDSGNVLVCTWYLLSLVDAIVCWCTMCCVAACDVLTDSGTTWKECKRGVLYPPSFMPFRALRRSSHPPPLNAFDTRRCLSPHSLLRVNFFSSITCKAIPPTMFSTNLDRSIVSRMKKARRENEQESYHTLHEPILPDLRLTFCSWSTLKDFLHPFLWLYPMA